MGSCTFTKDMSNGFALISGDCNPMHLNEEVARRTYFGETIVHGVHLLLQGCDLLCSETGRLFAPKQLKASFNKPVATGSTVDYIFEIDAGAGFVRLRGMCHNVQVFRAILYVQGLNDISDEYYSDAYRGSENLDSAAAGTAAKIPRDLDQSQLNGLCGEVTLVPPSTAQSEKLFPNLSLAWPRNVLHGMLYTTNIVGMHAPGLHSIFSNLDITWDYLPAGELRPHIAHYRVVNVHPTIRRCDVAADGADWHAKLQAFIRPKPCVQLPYAEICSKVATGAFAGQRALVLGGSRGIGEATSKLLAAGGAEVVLTYARSGDNAQSIVGEINGGGGKARALKLDVENQDHGIESLLPSDWSPTHLYYFITPPIAGDRYDFSVRVFDRYVLYYVSAFARAVSGLRKNSLDLRRVLWPSSVAITEVPSGMVEYAMAKSAGEILCESMMRASPDLVIQMPRLPRIRTDLTANPLVANGVDAAEAMLPILHELSRI